MIYSTHQEAGDLGSGLSFQNCFGILSSNYLIYNILTHAKILQLSLKLPVHVFDERRELI